ncbi:uncharacterized protein LOC134205484 [Armigeres subalbatus]|uniref:uncharacterized protein LOC134205484 n=1 Tax=Armigeres subalbatus TaxID=124917 RepID=UPI002ED5936E
MGSTKFQLIFTVILVYQINSIDTRKHAEQHPAAFRRSVAGGGVGGDGDGRATATPSSDANHSHATGEDNRSAIRSETLSLSKQGAKNSFTGDESAGVWPRLRRSLGGSTGPTGSQSLCNKEGCSCLDQPILTIDCEVHDRELKLFGQYHIPKEAKSLNLRLVQRHARLLIQTEQFENSLLNRVLIKGNFAGNDGREHIEFLDGAFCRNNGTYPELEVYNIHTVVFHKHTFCQEFMLNVTSSKEVIIMPEAFSVPESEILFNGVRDIRIQEDAFRNSIATKIDIVNSAIKTLFELRASFRQIQFINSTIEEISTKAFDVNKIDSLIFENCRIDVLKSEAITEKLLCRYFTMNNCKIKRIEKNFIGDSGMMIFNMQNNVIDEIAAEAIKFTGISSKVVNNVIKMTGKNWFFQKQGWTSVQFLNNSFGEFNYFTLERTSSPEVCKFHGNSVTIPAIRSFSFFQHKECSLSEISFNKLCNCDEHWLQELYFQDYDKLLRESYCRIDEALRYCFNATTFNVKVYMQQVCDETTRTIDCSRSQKEKKVEPHFVSPDEIESLQYNDYIQYILIGIAVIALLVIIILSVVFCKVCSRRQTDNSGDVISNASFTMTHKPSKAFSKDDKKIIHQTLETIKEKQPPEMYEAIFIHTKKLLDGNFTETEKVLTIGEIVRLLNECENSGDDFVAFTDILYRHLAPSTSPTPHETVYAEPTAPQDGTTIIQGAGAPDHIYAELTSAAQPLLINEYSAPMDLNDSHYSEPVQIVAKDNTRTLITPYAIGNNIGDTMMQQQPGPSRNLPDILNSNGGNSAGSTSTTPPNAIPVPEPLRYMDRSPTSSREIPEYTLPAKKVPPPKPALRREPTVESDTGSSTSSSDHSEHSGGSDITVKIDDIVEYADA